MTTTPQSIPLILRERPQWFLHNSKKCPVDPDGRPASYTNPKNYSTFDETLDWLLKTNLPGLGYVFDESDPFVGVDLDGCRNVETGELAPWARDIVDTLNSYTEISPSKTGLKIFLLGVCPYPGGRNERIDFVEKVTERTPGFEIYSQKRFFTVTGNHLDGTPLTVNSSTELLAICEKYLPEEKKTDAPKRKPNGSHQHLDRRSILASAEKYVAKMPPAVSGESGHKTAYHTACVLIQGFNLSIDEAHPIYKVWSQTCSPPWNHKEIQHKLESATKAGGEVGYLLNADNNRNNRNCRIGRNGKPSNGSSGHQKSGNPAATSSAGKSVVIANGREYESQDENGKPKRCVAPLPMVDIISNIKQATGNWPRRAGERLFVHDGGSTVDLFERPNEIFGWLGSKTGHPPKFYTTAGFHKESEVASEFKRTATTYKHIEQQPHWPPYPEHYYCCEIPKPGDGKLFERLLNYFSPLTAWDKDLIKLLFATAFWGGKGGQKPAFLITADAGRGCGKSALVAIVGLLARGMIDISCGEDIDKIKKRLLSRDGVTQRLVLLDNLKAYKFSWGEYESLITSPEISGWLMYVGNGSRPNNLLWTITQNGIGLSTDMAQRCVIIQLSRPEYAGGWLEDVQNFVTENRDGIIADIIGFLKSEKKPLAKWSRWGSWESEVLAGLANPEQVQRLILQRQQEADTELDESAITEDYFREQVSAAGYNTDTEIVFIPSSLATGWFNLAHTERLKTGKVSRIIKQAIRENKFENLQETEERRKSRGFLWVGLEVDIDETISFDLETRIEESKRNYLSDRD